MKIFGMFWCKACKERSHTNVECKSVPGKCKECENSRNQRGGVAKLSVPNDLLDPCPNGHCLQPGLETPTQIEEMLLGRMFPIMRVFCLGNGEIGHRGFVSSVEQDTSPIFTSLPVRPKPASVPLCQTEA